MTCYVSSGALNAAHFVNTYLIHVFNTQPDYACEYSIPGIIIVGAMCKKCCDGHRHRYNYFSAFKSQFSQKLNISNTSHNNFVHVHIFFKNDYQTVCKKFSDPYLRHNCNIFSLQKCSA